MAGAMSVTTATEPPGFQAYGPDHWAALALIGALSAALVVWLRRSQETPRGAAVRGGVCAALALLLVLAAGFEQLYEFRAGAWSVATSLPLHLCDIGLVCTAAALAAYAGRRGTDSSGARRDGPARRQFLFELSYYWGLGGTSQALLTPDVAVGFPRGECLNFFIMHGTIVVAVLVLTFGLRLRPRPASLPRVWLVTFLLAAAVYVVNWALDANYMFLTRPPDQPSLLDWFGPYPGALVPLVGVGTAILVLCYLPWWLVDRRGRVSRSRTAVRRLR